MCEVAAARKGPAGDRRAPCHRRQAPVKAPPHAASNQPPSPSPIVIAVDGPAASGKGTIARALATHFGLPHMDTGMLYRAVALTMFRFGGDPGKRVRGGPRLRGHRPGRPDRSRAAERDRRLDRQPHLGLSRGPRRAARPAAQLRRPGGGAVLDGRDIGTVIAPDATAKLFVTASRRSPRPPPRRRAARARHAGAL